MYETKVSLVSLYTKPNIVSRGDTAKVGVGIVQKLKLKKEPEVLE